jgi:hypothetical protein
MSSTVQPNIGAGQTLVICRRASGCYPNDWDIEPISLPGAQFLAHHGSQDLGVYLKLAALLALALTGCVVVEVGDRDGGQRTARTHIGITRIVTPEVPDGLSAVEVKTLGVGWDKGPFLGWHAGNWITADPAKCQLVVIVRTPLDAEHAARIMQAMEGQDPCIADFSGSLRQP